MPPYGALALAALDAALWMPPYGALAALDAALRVHP